MIIPNESSHCVLLDQKKKFVFKGLLLIVELTLLISVEVISGTGEQGRQYFVDGLGAILCT